MTNWEKEKAYCERRASELREAMSEAIEHGQDDEFRKLHETSSRYLKKKERNQIMREYLESRRA